MITNLTIYSVIRSNISNTLNLYSETGLIGGEVWIAPRLVPAAKDIVRGTKIKNGELRDRESSVLLHNNCSLPPGHRRGHPA